jgi:hypothetical protein
LLLSLIAPSMTPPAATPGSGLSYGPGWPLPQYMYIRVQRRFSASVAGSCAAQLIPSVNQLPKNVSGGTPASPISVPLMISFAPTRISGS